MQLYVFEVRAEDDALCSVSPEFRAIRIGDKAINTYQGILAGCGDGTTGWLYYLQYALLEAFCDKNTQIFDQETQTGISDRHRRI